MPEPLTVDDLLASAVATESRVDGGHCPGTAERFATLARAAEADLQAHPVRDLRCRRVMGLGSFIRHCAQVDHTIADVLALPAPRVPEQADELDEARLRDLGRGGESKTAALQ